MHNGHELSAYAVHHNEKDGSAFNIMEWNTEHNSCSTLWKAPATAFKYDFAAFPVYRYYRQLAIAENNISPLGRSNGAVSTDLYLCSPGSGIGSYTITTPDTPTGIDVTDASDHGLVQHGNKLFVRGSEREVMDALLVVMDLSGRVVKTVDLRALNDSEIDLSSLVAPGIYVVRLGADVLKVMAY